MIWLRQRAPRVGIGAVLPLLIGIALPATASAHSPHDDIFDVAIAYHPDGRTTIFATVRGNLLRSSDGGRTWEHLGLGLTNSHMLFLVAVAPSDPDVVYTSSVGGEVFRSVDGGSTWARTGHTGDPQILTLAVSPTAPWIIGAMTASGGLWWSRDGGVGWTRLEDEGIVDAIAAGSPERGLWAMMETGELVELDWASGTVMGRHELGLEARATALSGSEEGLLLGLVDGGVHFWPHDANGPSSLGRPSPGHAVLDVRSRDARSRRGPTSGLLVAAVERGGPFCLRPDRDAWTPCDAGTLTIRQALELGRPDFSSIVWSPDASGGDGRLLLAGYTGLYATDDPADGWVEIPTLSGDEVVGLDVATGRDRQDVLAATAYLWGAFLSEDGGGRWRSINLGARDSPRSHGFTRLFDVHLGPVRGGDLHLFTSTWYGWLHRRPGTDRWRRRQADELRTEGGRYGPLAIGLAPDFADSHTLLLGTADGAIRATSDAGSSFEERGRIPQPVNDLEISPLFERDSLLFAGGSTALYRSGDGGRTWTEAVTFGRAPDITLPVRGGSLHERSGAPWQSQLEAEGARAFPVWVEFSPTFAEDSTVFAAGFAGLARSRDGGMTFDRLPLVEEGEAPLIQGFAVSPDYRTDGRIAVLLRGVGLMESANRGESFRLASEEAATLALGNATGFPLPLDNPVQFSPTGTSTLYAFGPRGVWSWGDDGTSWTLLWEGGPDRRTRLLTRFHAFGDDVEGGVRRAVTTFLGSSRRRAVTAIAGTLMILVLGWTFRRHLERSGSLDRDRSSTAGAEENPDKSFGEAVPRE